MKDAPEPAPSTGRLFLSVFPSIMLPMFLAVVDQTIVSTALPAIAASLGNVERVSWVVVAYLLAGTIAAPVYGQLRDVYGGRRMMFVALAIFLAASVFCAAATSIEMLAIGRILQGLGGGGLMTLSQALIGEAIPPRERARYQGYLAGVAVSSSTFGPVVGGLLTQHFGWRSIFLINLPLGLIAVLLTLRLEQRPGRQQAWSFDGMGLVLFIAFITPVLLALQEAQRMSASALPSFLVLMGVGIAALLGLILRERRATTPLLPIHLLRQPTIWRSDALAACHGATLVSLITFIPIYLRVLRGTSASETGLLMLPLMFGIGAGSMATGRVVSRTGRTAIYPSLGLIVVTAALVALGLARGRPRHPPAVALPVLHRPVHGHGDGRGAGDGAERGGARLAGLGGGLRAALPLDRRGGGHGTRRHRAVCHAGAQRPRDRPPVRHPGAAGPGRDRRPARRASGHGARRNRHRLPRRLPHHGRVLGRRPAAGVVHPDAAVELMRLADLRVPTTRITVSGRATAMPITASTRAGSWS